MNIIKLYLFVSIIVLFLGSSNLFSQPTTAEDFTVTDIDGNVHNLYTYLDEGKYVYLDFFLTDCGGCIGSIPRMNNIYQRFGCNEFDLMLIAVFGGYPDNAEVEQFRTDHGPLFPLVSSEGGSASVVAYYEVEGFPESILIKPDRSVIWSSDYNLDNPDTIQLLGPHQNACPDQWPIADFVGDPLVIPVHSQINFTDLSQNPIHDWIWEFPGGNPNTFNGQNPPEIIYDQSGYFDVKLTVINEFGNTNSLTKNDYVLVYDIADTLPVANFTADQILLVAGNSTNFNDLSYDFPFEWHWTFEGAQPSNSNIENPQNIVYNSVGEFDVQLIVRNSEGYDTIVKENYIKVIPDVGQNPPQANFTTNYRLIQKNTKVYFEDLSSNNPMTWSWYFEGGDPSYLSTQLQPEGILYPNTGFFDVTLNVSNVNGSSVLTKRDYIVVYESTIGKICDTIQNLLENEVPYAMQIFGMDGYYGGHNEDRINAYADYYQFHTFNKVYGVIVPIMKLSYGSYNSYIRFITWDGVEDSPTTILGEQKVYLKDLRENFWQVILFDEPLDIDGPFYLGYTLNYAEGDNFVVGLAPNRGNGGINTLWVRKNNVWYNSASEYQISTSTGIRPITCLVGIEDDVIEQSFSVYPNPCNDKFFISTTNAFNSSDLIDITDLSGKTIKQIIPEVEGNQVEINTENLNPGVYYLRIFSSGKLIYKKINVIR